jgi:hypothetical protein
MTTQNLPATIDARQGTLSHRIRAEYAMNRRTFTHLERSWAVIDGLRAATGLGLSKLDRVILERGYADVDPRHWPRADTRESYLKGKRPLPYERARAGVRCYLEAIEVAYPESTRIFFHPFWTLLGGPLPTSSRYETTAALYPSSQIHQRQSSGRASGARLAHELRQYNQRILRSGKRRRQGPPGLSIAYVHLCMCQVAGNARDLFAPIGGSPFGVSRRYRPASVEDVFLDQTNDLDTLTLALALLLEAVLIGDEQRAAVFKQRVARLTGAIDEDSRFRRAAPIMHRLIEGLIANTLVRRYTSEEVLAFGRISPAYRM